MPSSAHARISANPFFVLGLGPDTSRPDLEREASKLLGLLALGVSSVATYETPLGPQPRTDDLVRQAMATLRDPARRLHAEVWARASIGQTAPVPAPPPKVITWPTATVALGFQRREEP